MTRVDEWLRTAEMRLQATNIPSARLDAMLLLSDALQKSKSWILAHGEEVVPRQVLDELEQKLQRRLKREPMAYIRGYQEFYGHNFHVNQQTLIPRPETEVLVDELQSIAIKNGDILVDVGTGSGCIAITAKLEHPELKVYALDISEPALAVAKQNATRLQANIAFRQTDLLQTTTLPQPISIITANLPYVDRRWQISPEVSFEPPLALFASTNGLSLILKLLAQSAKLLRPKGHLLLEADPRQHADIAHSALNLGFEQQRVEGFMLHFQKI